MQQTHMRIAHHRLAMFVALLAGFAGGIATFVMGVPMPFLIGGVFGSAVFVGWYESGQRRLRKLHPGFRFLAIAATGSMIGCNVTPDVLGVLPQYWISALAIAPFILVAHGGGHLILRRFGGYRPVDAYFASIPGGLIEAVLLGEKAGADVKLLTVHHFIRLICIVIAVPLLFLLFTGEVVGSASGAAEDTRPYSPFDIAEIALIAMVGAWLGRKVSIPAAHLLGPLMLAMALSISGVIAVSVPGWLLHLAQYVIGVTLGLQFSGISRALLTRALGLGVIAVGYMLAVGFAFAIVLEPLVPSGVAAMFISFAAGGVAEMSLIALSLNLSPVIVALHHLIRIFLAIWIGQRVASYLLPARLEPDDGPNPDPKPPA